MTLFFLLYENRIDRNKGSTPEGRDYEILSGTLIKVMYPTDILAILIVYVHGISVVC